MSESVINQDKPNLHPRLFWDQRYAEIEWREDAVGVIERVLERGDASEYLELIRFYGRERIVTALTNEPVILPNFLLEEVAGYFGLKKEELYSFRKRQGKAYHWK